jgi:hypothetical protein
MEERSYQGPYQKTLEQATEIVHLVIDNPAGVTFDRKDNKQYTDSALLTPMDVCDDLEIKAYYTAYAAAKLARWMDALPMSVRYIRACRHYNTWYAWPVTAVGG